MWSHAIIDEAFASTGLAAATFLSDLVKAYDSVEWPTLVHECGLQEFPWVLLRLALDAYAGERRVVWQGAISEPVFATKSIAAGCGFATSLLRGLLLRTLDALAEAYPAIQLHVVVDDVSGQATGTPKRVEELTVAFAAELTARFEDELHLKKPPGPSRRS